VEYPEKTDQLLAVYHAIVDNVVTWRCLKENKENKEIIKLKPNGFSDYKELMRETMIWLLTRPHWHREDDVIFRAIEYGAYAMLHEILNTRGVFRFVVCINYSKASVDLYSASSCLISKALRYGTC